MVTTIFKKSILALSLCTATANGMAQVDKTTNQKIETAPWYVGLGVFGGGQTGNLDQITWSQYYLNPLNVNISNLEHKSASHLGFNASMGYYFGKKRMFGLGTGFQLLQSQFDLGLETFALDFESVDAQGQTFRQRIRANNSIQEQIQQTTLGVPVLLLFKKDLGKNWGINLDAGMVFNFSSKGTFSAQNVNFDYEAIYMMGNNGATVYDNNPTPDPNSWLITEEHYNRVNPNGNVNTYFEGLQNQGFNVGLGVKPEKLKGDLNDLKVNASWMIRPSVSYKLSSNVALHINFMLQQVKTTFASNENYRMTDQLGSYASLSNGLKSNTQLFYNLGLGLRYYFGAPKAKTPPPAPPVVVVPVEKKPEPVVVELPKEQPKKSEVKEDPYKEMVKVTVKLQDEQYGKPVAGNIFITQGTKTVFNGKADQSGISNFYLEPGNYAVEVKAVGYLTAEEDLQLAPTEKGKSKTIELKQPKIEKGLTFKLKNINFETGSDKITVESYVSLDKMAEILKENPTMVVEVGGHTDNSGDAKKNLELSKKRETQVVNYLIAKGVNVNQMKAIGYGQTKPVADNATPEGKALNRRVMFTVIGF